MQANGFNGNLT